MQTLRLYRVLIFIQGSYTLLTAVWALIDIDSFMLVTGPKSDIWLVKTVAVVLISVGLSLLASFKKFSLTAVILGFTTALGLACIDFYYTSQQVIKWVYAIDGVIEIIFSIGWLIVLVRTANRNHIL